MHGKDPENFFIENINQKALNKRLKAKGIHTASHIVEDQIPQQNEEVEVNDNNESEYILPSTSEQSAFVPRRRLPDDAFARFPGSGPSPPCATPVGDCTPPSSQTTSADPTFSNCADVLSPSIEPTLSNDDFEYSWSSRSLVSPPSFLTK